MSFASEVLSLLDLRRAVKQWIFRLLTG